MASNHAKGGINLKQRLYRLLCLICAFTLCMSCIGLPAGADDGLLGKAASVYGYALNDEMFRYGILSVPEKGAALDNPDDDGIYPNGVIYADTVNFDKNDNPYLVIFRADSEHGCMCVDICGYDTREEKTIPVVTLVKSYPDAGTTAQLALGVNHDERYVIYNEYQEEELTCSEYYTVIDNTAFRYVSPPDYAQIRNIVTYDDTAIYPDVDIAPYNAPLENFFTELKNAAADSVTYEDIAEKVDPDEENRIEATLTKAAKFNYLDISHFRTMEDYEAALRTPDADNIFYTITHLYDLEDEIYYVRFATNNAFYNYALLRRTGITEDGYQLLAVRTDSIPLSDTELKAFKDEYMHNKLLFKKSRGSIEDKNAGSADGDSFHRLNIKKVFNIPKIVSDRVKLPLALIGGGVCLALFVALWAIMVSED